MNEAQSFFAQPGVGFFMMILVGATAGYGSVGASP